MWDFLVGTFVVLCDESFLSPPPPVSLLWLEGNVCVVLDACWYLLATFWAVHEWVFCNRYNEVIFLALVSSHVINTNMFSSQYNLELHVLWKLQFLASLNLIKFRAPSLSWGERGRERFFSSQIWITVDYRIGFYKAYNIVSIYAYLYSWITVGWMCHDSPNFQHNHIWFITEYTLYAFIFTHRLDSEE